jgi:hypothetical protein
LTDDKIAEYRKLIKLGKVPDSEKMSKEQYGLRTEFVYLRLRSYDKLS